MEPWLTIVVAGAAIAGYGWLKPEKKAASPVLVGEDAYDKLLEDLETENRELLDAVSLFKQEQDDTLKKLGLRIKELEKQMSSWSERSVSPATAGGHPNMTDLVPPVVSVKLEKVVEETAATGEKPSSAMGMAEAQQDVQGQSRSIRQRYAELIEMDERGRSIEQIAKAMNMNKGEVQLILQLARREGERHV